MPTCTKSESRKKVDYFQRRKVGSIRDNPKLMKIRQQFENASKENHSSHTSASSNSKTNVLGELLKKDYGNSIDVKSDRSRIRRNSESAIGDSQSLTSRLVTVDQNTDSIVKETKYCSENYNLSRSVDNRLDFDSLISLVHCSAKNSALLKRDTPPSLDSALTQALASEKAVESPKKTLSASSSIGNETASDGTESTLVYTPPPLPKRGLSPATQSFLCSSNDKSKRSLLIRKELFHKDTKKVQNVQEAIELYEGMTLDSPKKNKLAKSYGSYHKMVKRGDSFSRSLNKTQHGSRRNSFRKPKYLSEYPPLAKHKNEVFLREESDCEEGSNNIYQTLSTTEVIPTFGYDPYDRLNRIHDVLHQIHKGRTSTCAACKAIPPSVLQLQETALLKVKCHEASPHHHPPCICFSCQHSVFSCSTDSDSSAVDAAKEDGLYYNLCCLNPPNHESWRQSRRRPICEQNGRLCVVNCDIEKTACAKESNPEKNYENLSNYLVMSHQQQNPAKQVTGDSCESDEGWVDESCADSEDDKSYIVPDESWTSISCHHAHNATEQNNGISFNEIDDIASKCSNLNLSLSLSTEHLYESINEVDSEEVKENLDCSANNCNYDSKVDQARENNCNYDSKVDQAHENDLDSGEWSTESESPVFNESFNENSSQKTSLNQCRFLVGAEMSDTAKKTFMKSVLGKKTNHPKKRKMSNFFVPSWLVSGNEYYPTEAKNEKLCSKKLSCSQTNFCISSKRNDASKRSLSRSSPGLYSSEVLTKYKTIETDKGSTNLSENSFSSPEATPSFSSRRSINSSTYLRNDQLHSTGNTKRKTSLPCNTSVDVSVERVCRRSSSGNSDHTYILFSPIKEDQVPLYQFYERNVKERVSFCRSSSKSMSPIMWVPENVAACSEVKPHQLSVVEQLSPEATDVKMSWCELSEVKESGILERISAQELKLQEAIFEFIQSQASYVRSLKVLYENFIQTPEFSTCESPSSVLSKHEQDVLFSDIIQLKDVSERILYDVTARWGDSILIPDICDIILHHAQLPAFSMYIKYCKNRVYQERTLKELKESRLCFLEALRNLECKPICQGLSLESFLLLPMQHISRLPLLLDNIFRWISADSPAYSVCKSALEAVHKIFMECNESARKMERLEEMFVLNKQLEFKECKVIPLISASRWLLKKGKLVRLEFDKKTFGRSNRCVRISIFLFLFNDLLVVTKRKNDDSYTVLDYCLREKVQATAINAKDLQQPLISSNTCRYLIYLKLLSNHQGASTDMILNCTLLSERTRWIEAINSAGQNKSCEISEYDCPQVQCIKHYIAQQPDELSLQESDVVTVHRKMDDGWYEGRRLRDGHAGWFPASYTMDIPCSRARASNLRQCYRLLMISQQKS